MSAKDAKQLVRELRKHWRKTNRGFTVVSEGGHWRIYNAAGQRVYSFGSTPSDVAFRRNTVSDLRNLGVVDDDFR